MMTLYAKSLRDEGISSTRVEYLYSAIKLLHCAICKLDLENLKKFLSKSLEKRLTEFAEIEEYRNPFKGG